MSLVTTAGSLDANWLRILAEKVNDLVPDGEEVKSDPTTAVLRTLVDHLRNFVSDNDVAVKNDVSELKFRLGALVQDAFGPLFTSAMTLDWDRSRKYRTRSAHSKHWDSDAPVSRRAIPSNLMKSSSSATPTG